MQGCCFGFTERPVEDEIYKKDKNHCVWWQQMAAMLRQTAQTQKKNVVAVNNNSISLQRRSLSETAELYILHVAVMDRNTEGCGRL